MEKIVMKRKGANSNEVTNNNIKEMGQIRNRFKQKIHVY